jgi:hypothetical protein
MTQNNIVLSSSAGMIFVLIILVILILVTRPKRFDPQSTWSGYTVQYVKQIRSNGEVVGVFQISEVSNGWWTIRASYVVPDAPNLIPQAIEKPGIVIFKD